MKQLALLLVGVALIYASNDQTQPEGYFAAGREYVYRYEGQALSGLPGVSKEVAGIKIVADARIQMKELNKCLLRMEQVKLYKVQTETEDPTKQQTEEKLQRLQPEYETRLLTQLVKQIAFTYVDGKVTDIVSSQEEPAWATNIKKGMMELMLVNIRGTDDLNQPKTQRTESTSILNQKKHYRVMERGIAGNCEAVYNVKVSEPVGTIIDKRVQPFRFVMHITKTRDLLECQERTQRTEVSILSGRKCAKCMQQNQETTFTDKPTEQKEDLLKCLSKVHYGISLKDHTKFVIDTVVAEGQHIFMPFGEKGGRAITFVNQMFVLKSNKEIQVDEHIPEVQNPKLVPEELKFVFEETKGHVHDAEEERELTAKDAPHMSQIRVTVNDYLQKIVDGFQADKITEEAPLNFIYMVKSLKRLSPIELQNVFDRLGKKLGDDDEPTKQKKQILLDAIMQVENDKAVEILTGEIEKRHIVDEEASQILTTLALINNPTEEMVDKVLALCKGSALSVSDVKPVWTTCWLTFGSLFHKACKVKKICSQDKIQEYSLNLLNGIDATRPNEDKHVCLKAIGNAGLVLKKSPESEVDSIDRLTEIIKDKVGDIDLRVQAIYSLRRVCNMVPKRILPLLLPFIKDFDEDHEIRIASYVIAMDCKPKVDIVQSIVSDLKKDKSKQVVSFIYTHLEGLVANWRGCDWDVTKVAKKALLTLEPLVKGMQYSKRFMWSPTAYQEKVSLITEASIIGTPTSPFPVSSSVKLGATILNRQMNIMEVGFHAKGLRDIVEKIMGVARPVRPTIEKLIKSNRRVPEEQSITERDLDQLDQELPTTKVHSNQEMVKVSAFLKLFGNELRTVTIDKSTIWDWLEGRSERMAEIENKILTTWEPYKYRKIFSLGRGKHEVPTEIGLPLQLSMDSAAILALDVTGKASMSPKLTEVLRTKNGKLNNVSVAGEVMPRAAVTIKAKMSVKLHDCLMTGIGLIGSLNTSVVLRGNVTVDVPKRLYHTQFDTPTSEHQTVWLRSKPFTYNMLLKQEPTGETIQTQLNLQQPLPMVFEERPILGKLMAKEPITNTWSVGKKAVGVELELMTSRVPRSCTFKYRPTQVLFNGPIVVGITARRGENAPNQVIACMKLENEFHSQQQYQEFKNKFLKKQHFFTASSSESESDEVVQEQTVQEQTVQKQASFRTGGVDMMKRFEDWKYDNAKWPFEGEDLVVDTVHDDTEMVTPDNTKSVELYHIYFNVTTVGTQPIRELISRISLDQQNEFYKAVRVDILTNKKTFVQDSIRQDQFNDQIDKIKTFCVQGELEHPAYAVTLQDSQILQHIEGLPDVARDPKVLFKLSTQWGKSCEVHQKMQLKARVERSEEQKRRLNEDTPDKMECLKNLQENNKYTQACKRLRLDREELRAVHAELTHNELMKKTYKVAFYQGLEMVKMWLWGYMNTQQAEVHNADKTVLLTGELDQWSKKVDIAIKHVRANVKFDKVPIPQMVQDTKIITPYKLQQHMIMSYAGEWLSGRNINQCKALRNHTVITFDKVQYEYKQSQCEHILAKDCSSKERFVVLTRKMTPVDTCTKKVVTVYIDNTKIQFVPSQDGNQISTLINNSDSVLPVLTKLIIQDDGIVKKVPIDVPTIHIMELAGVEEPIHSKKSWDVPESSSSEEVQITSGEMTYLDELRQHVKTDIAAAPQQLPHRAKTVVQIIRTKPGESMMLFAPEQELKVFFDGHNVKVELPQKYKDMQCGLCGDFNGETANEMVGPNREVYKNAHRFGPSFQYSTPECSKLSSCAPTMEFAFDTEVLLTKRDEQSACITKSPLPHCQPTCTAAQQEPIDVEFVCISHEGTTDPFKSLTREQIINKYGAKMADYKRTMEMAVKCIRAE